MVAVEGFMASMSWQGRRPVVVERLTAVYATGVRLTQQAMQALEAQFTRLVGLGKWFVQIPPLGAVMG